VQDYQKIDGDYRIPKMNHQVIRRARDSEDALIDEWDLDCPPHVRNVTVRDLKDSNIGAGGSYQSNLSAD